jgi:O-antigen/teichoic acid export membrane protein
MKASRTTRFGSIAALYKNFIALSAGTSLQFVIQIVSLPLFLRNTGVNQYASWLLAYNIAQIASLMDFGSVSALQNYLSRFQFEKNFSAIDISIKQNVNILFSGNLLFILLLVALKTCGFQVLNLNLIIVFVASNLLQSSMGLLEAMSRADNSVSTGLYFSNLIRLAEFLGTVIGIFVFESSIFKIACLAFLCKFFIFISTYKWFISRYQFIRFGRPQIREIFLSINLGFTFLLARISDLITINGFLIVLNSKLSPRDFVLFVSARTFFRIGLQIMGLITHSFSYEISRYWISNEFAKMRKTISQSAKITFFLAGTGAFLYLILGNWMFALWINRQIPLDEKIVVFGAIYAFLICMNQNQKAKFYAVNRSGLVSFVQIAFSLGLLVATHFPIYAFRVWGVFLMLAIFEFANLVLVYLLNRYYKEMGY